MTARELRNNGLKRHVEARYPAGRQTLAQPCNQPWPIELFARPNRPRVNSGLPVLPFLPILPNNFHAG